MTIDPISGSIYETGKVHVPTVSTSNVESEVSLVAQLAGVDEVTMLRRLLNLERAQAAHAFLLGAERAYMEADKILEHRAKLFAQRSGEAGPMSSEWGWRDTAKHLWQACDRILERLAETRREIDRMRAVVESKQ